MTKLTTDQLKEKIEGLEASGDASLTHVTMLKELLAYGQRREGMAKGSVLVPTDMAGVRQLHDSLVRLQRDLESSDVSHTHAKHLRRDIDELRKIMREPSRLKRFNGVAASKSRTVVKDGVVRGWFEHDGIKFWKPADIVEVEGDLGVYATGEEDLASVRLDMEDVEAQRNAGNFLVILKKVTPRGTPFGVLVVTPAAILKSREQRLQLAYTEGEGMVAQLIERDLGGKVDKRIKDATKIVDKHKEDYLSTTNPAAIAKDIHRIIAQQ